MRRGQTFVIKHKRGNSKICIFPPAALDLYTLIAATIAAIAAAAAATAVAVVLDAATPVLILLRFLLFHPSFTIYAPFFCVHPSSSIRIFLIKFQAGKGVLIVARVIEGLGEGVALPAMQAMIAKWTPTNERAWLASIIYAGTQVIRVFDFFKKGCFYFLSHKTLSM